MLSAAHQEPSAFERTIERARLVKQVFIRLANFRDIAVNDWHKNAVSVHKLEYAVKMLRLVQKWKQPTLFKHFWQFIIMMDNDDYLNLCSCIIPPGSTNEYLRDIIDALVLLPQDNDDIYAELFVSIFNSGPISRFQDHVGEEEDNEYSARLCDRYVKMQFTELVSAYIKEEFGNLASPAQNYGTILWKIFEAIYEPAPWFEIMMPEEDPEITHRIVSASIKIYKALFI